MSTDISRFLNQRPLLLRYTQKGLINLNALARLIQEENQPDYTSIAAISMELRRYLDKLPQEVSKSINFSDYCLQITTRSNIVEIVLTKDANNRVAGLKLVNIISQSKNFVSLVEGEKELVIMTDYSIRSLLEKENLEVKYIEGLSFISINFPIELRELPGVYSIVTQNLAETDISIHSFHTIGGEILILVKNADLLKTQEVLTALLESPVNP